MALSCCCRLLKALEEEAAVPELLLRRLPAAPGLRRGGLLAGQEASGLRLEGDDDDGELEVPLLLQLGQHSGPEEHLTLADAIEVGIQIQMFDLEENSLFQPWLGDPTPDPQRNVSGA